MNEKPFFSVVIPLYNKAQHIERSVKSVLKQTLQDFELIIVNDASNDGSVEIVQKFKDNRIQLLHRSVPGPGGYAARNLGIKKAKGEWIAFLDADDEWYQEHLEKMKKLSSLFPKIYFMGCGWHHYLENIIRQDEYFKRFKHKEPHLIDATTYLRSCLDNYIPVHTSIACIKRNSPVASDLFPADKKANRGGDLHSWLKMICYHKAMAWSNHIGAVYYRDSLNTVTKIAQASPYLMTTEIYNELELFLSNDEKILLKKYFNMRLRNSWFGNLLRETDNFFLPSRLYWKDDLLNALLLFVMVGMPKPFLRKLIKIRKKIKDQIKKFLESS
jgi:glycosyltransferase involved in cell wall biosynthesis